MGYFETRFQFNEKRTVVWGVVTWWLTSKFPLGDRVLDAGCGYGDFINNIRAKERFALDLLPEAKKHVHETINFQSGSISELGTLYQGRKFSTIFSSNVLEHLDRAGIDNFFVGARDLLDENGQLILLIPNYKRAYREYFDDYTHVTPLSDSGLGDWLRAAGFEVKYSHPGFLPYSMKNSRIPVLALLVWLWLLSPWKPGGKQMLFVARKKR